MTKARDLANLGAIASGGLFFRNRIINGNAQIAQRGVVSLASVAAVYATDRFLMGIVSGTGISANAFKGAYAGSSSGYGHYFSGSMTGGTPYWCQRIEQANIADLAGKSITISGLLYQDTGSSQTFSLRLTKAASADNWSTAGTVIGTNTSIIVPSAVSTPFSVTFTLGASDAGTGLMVEVYTTSTVTCTSKYFALTDLQLEKGAVATPFEFRPIGTELAFCQRYYDANTGEIFGAPANGTTNIQWGGARFTVEMRAAPTVVLYGNGVANSVRSAGGATVTLNSPSIGASSKGLGYTNVSSGLTGGTWYQAGYTASAEL